VEYTEAVAALRRIPLFASLDTASLKLLAFSSTALDFDDGEALCHQGDPADSVYVVDQGQVKVSIETTPDAGVFHVATLGRHDLFGEMAVICNLPRTATVRAVGPLRVLKIEADIFMRLVTANPDAAVGVMRVLALRLMRATDLYERAQRGRPVPDSDAPPVEPAASTQ